MTGPSLRGESSPPGHQDEVSLLRAATVVLRRRRMILGTMVATVLAVVVGTLLWPRTYTCEASFLPEEGQTSLSALSSVAAQFGFALPTTEGGESPAFYADLLTSRIILRDLVTTVYQVNGADGKDSLRLSDYFRQDGGSQAEILDRTEDKLRKQIAVQTDRETGVVTVRVKTKMPDLSQEIAVRMLDLMSEFNLHRRQTRASAERVFVGERLDSANADLRAAEDRLQQFLVRNREWSGAPQLVFEHDRLQRAVTMQQEVYTSLAQAYEQARIEEVRNTPVTTVIEEPNLPARPDRRRLLLKTIFAIIAGTMLGVGLAVTAEAFRRQEGERASELAELRRVRNEAMLDLRRPWRLFVRRRGEQD